MVKKYRTILIDPPWKLSRGPMGKKNLDGSWATKSYSLPYQTMSIEEIRQLPILELAEKNAHLYIWTVNRYIDDTYSIARYWGFMPNTLLTWTKTPKKWNIGGDFMQTTEHILYCKRGKLSCKLRANSTWWNWKRGKHSKKPDEFQDIIEAVSHPPYLELFARRKRGGWDVWGNEVESDIEISDYISNPVLDIL